MFLRVMAAYISCLERNYLRARTHEEMQQAASCSSDGESAERQTSSTAYRTGVRKATIIKPWRNAANSSG